ncbi:MAG TPA: enoyl-CoA hydratase-related protein [Euzebyales bacterium]
MTDVHVAATPPLLVVTLQRGTANTIDAATSRRLGEVFSRFRDDAQLRVAIVTGAGPRFFSAGWDLGAAASGEAYDADFGAGGFGGYGELAGLRKPVIAAVNGMAVGGGFELVLAADLAVAADHATFFLPETAVGVIPDSGSVRLPRLLPRPVAIEVLIAGRRLNADEALRWGVINRVVPADGLMTAATELAERIVDAAPLAVEAVLDLVRRTEQMAVVDSMRLLRSGTVDPYERMLASDDALEGPRAFAERRPPRWTGG